MIPEKIITGLSPLQADGLACMVCGVNYLMASRAMRPPGGGRGRLRLVPAWEGLRTAPRLGPMLGVVSAYAHKISAGGCYRMTSTVTALVSADGNRN